MSAALGPLFEVQIPDAADARRLSGQLAAVRSLMADGRWRTLAEIAVHVNGSEAGVSARLRDLRKPRHGGHTVERERVPGGRGLWIYRLHLAGGDR